VGVMPPIYYPPEGGGSPPGIWPSPGHPAHPIAPGGPPPGIWPPPGYPSPPIYYPPVGAMPPIYYPPVGAMPPIYYPPGIWPSPGHPAHPIAPGGLPGGKPPGTWGGDAPWPGYVGGGPIIPPSPPPGTWGGDAPWPGYATPPIAGPPVYNPLPPGFEQPPFPPTGPPDLASPGFWCYIVTEGGYQAGFIQLAINTSPDHEPKPPTEGLPGTYLAVFAGQFGPRSAWIPSAPPKPEMPPAVPTAGTTTPPPPKKV
jgi:hypothetical protein